MEKRFAFYVVLEITLLMLSISSYAQVGSNSIYKTKHDSISVPNNSILNIDIISTRTASQINESVHNWASIYADSSVLRGTLKAKSNVDALKLSIPSQNNQEGTISIAASSELADSIGQRSAVGKASQASYNLVPFQPSGWDNKIVLSTVTETTQTSSIIYDNQNIFLDWAALNNGTNDILQTFVSHLYIDGALKASFNSSGLLSSYYTYSKDVNIGTLSSGMHVIKIVVDATNVVSETNESDNVYSLTKTIYVANSVNLTPFKPDSYDGKIVLSTATGTHTSESAFYDNQMLYLDWTVINNGVNNISETFHTSLYVDGLLYKTYSTSGLGANYYTYVDDIAIDPLTAGTHVFKIVADCYGEVRESNENDNEFVLTVNVLSSMTEGVNLKPYKPSAWDQCIVLSTEMGSTISDPVIYSDQTIYLDWAVINNGKAHVTETFYTKLYVDGQLKATFHTNGLQSGYYAYVNDYVIGQLSAGTHLFEIIADANGNVNETIESDNGFLLSKTIVVAQNGNLKPYQPSSWDNKIVLSTQKETNFTSSVIYDNQTVYLDWAVSNDGQAIAQTFYTSLYVDEVLVGLFSSEGLPTNFYAYFNDYDIGQLSAGKHSIKLVTDSKGNVTETNENDNEFTLQTTILHFVIAPVINVTPSELTLNQSRNSNTKTPSYSFVSNARGSEYGRLGLDTIKNYERKLGCLIPDDVVSYWKQRSMSPLGQLDLPPVIDWSIYDSPVKDQQDCGSCWAFAATAFVENIGSQVDLSEQALISCSGAGSCDGGVFSKALDYIVNQGIPVETCYPYSSSNGSCDNVCPNPNYIERLTSVSNNLWGTNMTPGYIKAKLQNGPLVVRMLVPDDGTFYRYNGGVYHFSGISIPNTNGHAVLIVGYDDNQQCFKAKNSWGTLWGENGYFRISYLDVTNAVQFGSYAASGSGAYSYELSYNSFTISNNGGEPLTILSAHSDKGWLTLTGEQNFPLSVPSLSSSSLSVNIDWTKVGLEPQIATIVIVSNDPSAPSMSVQVTAIPSNDYIVTTVSNPIEGGIINGGGSYEANQLCTIEAIANSGYVFAGWSEYGVSVSDSELYAFSVCSDRSLVANFTTSTGVVEHLPSGVEIYSDDKKVFVSGALGAEIRIVDITGRIIKTQLCSNNSVEIPLPQIGLYLVQIQGNGFGCSRRVIVR